MKILSGPNRKVAYYVGLALVTSNALYPTYAAQPTPRSDETSAAQGKILITETRARLPDHVGNGLNCSNCHLDAGTRAYATPFTNIWHDYPTYDARSGKIISLADRINECFTRSMNGTALDNNSSQMRSILAYIALLSPDIADNKMSVGRGVGRISAALHADAVRGKQIFAQSCAACHGANGFGTRVANGQPVPPLWGPDSFNDGAGMARTSRAAAFVLHNMPLGKGNTLTEQDALDVAAFFTHQSRPVFARKSGDWPNGQKPADARN